jgi:hypothetical protein
MKTLVFDFDDFLKLFKFNKSISYADFCKQLSVLNISDTTGAFAVRSDIDTFIDRVSKKDNRKARLNDYKKKLYKMLVQEPEVALKEWFRRYGELPHDLNYYFQIPNGGILTGDTFQGIKNSKFGRVCKNINFEKFYNTKKLYNNDSEYTFGLLKAMFEDFKIRNSMAGPAFFDHICKIENSNYGQIWVDFMIGANRASIFNPATYKGILDELLPGETLFAPCMGWNAYQFAFYNSNFKHFVATDVIPEVVANGKKIHHAWQAYRDQSVFDLPEKTVKLYCSPSEDLRDTDFVAMYQNKVDAVLFSPPYFDLEIYDSADQSFSNYPDYQDWLKKYWEQTVIIAKQVLKPGGRFAFVISNYRNKAKQEVAISQDMKAVVDRHLNFKDQYKVQWSAISSGRQAKKMKNGNFEDLWLFEKC